MNNIELLLKTSYKINRMIEAGNLEAKNESPSNGIPPIISGPAIEKTVNYNYYNIVNQGYLNIHNLENDQSQ